MEDPVGARHPGCLLDEPMTTAASSWSRRCRPAMRRPSIDRDMARLQRINAAYKVLRRRHGGSF